MAITSSEHAGRSRRRRQRSSSGVLKSSVSENRCGRIRELGRRSKLDHVGPDQCLMKLVEPVVRANSFNRQARADLLNALCADSCTSMSTIVPSDGRSRHHRSWCRPRELCAIWQEMRLLRHGRLLRPLQSNAATALSRMLRSAAFGAPGPEPKHFSSISMTIACPMLYGTVQTARGQGEALAVRHARYCQAI